MSFELSTALVLTETEAAILRTRLIHRGYAVLPASQPLEIRLRYGVESHRSEWPEDVTVTLRPAITVSMHVGTRDQRRDLLACICDSLASMGYEPSFAEE